MDGQIGFEPDDDNDFEDEDTGEDSDKSGSDAVCRQEPLEKPGEPTDNYGLTLTDNSERSEPNNLGLHLLDPKDNLNDIFMDDDNRDHGSWRDHSIDPMEIPVGPGESLRISLDRGDPGIGYDISIGKYEKGVGGFQVEGGFDIYPTDPDKSRIEIGIHFEVLKIEILSLDQI